MDEINLLNAQYCLTNNANYGISKKPFKTKILVIVKIIYVDL